MNIKSRVDKYFTVANSDWDRMSEYFHVLSSHPILAVTNAFEILQFLVKYHDIQC